MAAWYWGLSDTDYKERADVWPLNPTGELLAVVQIETVKGLQHAEEIVSTPGVGVIFLGPGDLSRSIGENSPLTRAAVLAGLEELGIRLDPAANEAQGTGERPIHARDSAVKAFVIPTNEELVVARQARDLLAGGTADSHPGGG